MEYIWTDKEHKEHDIREIPDGYLLNIQRHVTRGGGYDVSNELIRSIFEEVNSRGLKNDLKLHRALQAWDLRRWAEEAEYQDLHHQD